MLYLFKIYSNYCKNNDENSKLMKSSK